jgi:hypothetical protein
VTLNKVQDIEISKLALVKAGTRVSGFRVTNHTLEGLGTGLFPPTGSMDNGMVLAVGYASLSARDQLDRRYIRARYTQYIRENFASKA